MHLCEAESALVELWEEYGALDKARVSVTGGAAVESDALGFSLTSGPFPS